MGAKIADEAGHLSGLQRLGQATGLAHEASAPAGTTRPHVAEETLGPSAQPGGSARSRNRVLLPQSGDDGELEQSPHSGDPSVHGGWGGPSAVVEANHLGSPGAPWPHLPVEVVEQVSRHDVVH